MLTVSVAGVPGKGRDAGLMEQVGARGGDGCTEHVRAAVPAPPPMPAVTAEVDEPPGFTVLGVSGESDTEKTGGGFLKSGSGDT